MCSIELSYFLLGEEMGGRSIGSMWGGEGGADTKACAALPSTWTPTEYVYK